MTIPFLHLLRRSIQTNPQLYNFDNLGNITNKSGVGSGTAGPGQYSYTYSQAACASVTGAAPSGPHAVTSIGGITSGNNGAFCYDADGNLLQDPWRTTSWTDFDMPATITEGSNSSTFTYGPEHQRTRQIRSDITLLYADGMEIDTPTNGSGTNTIKTYWPAGLGLETSTGGAPTYTWTHGDNLDSVVAITDVNGNLVQQMAYDAWGARRDLQGDAGVVSAASGYLNGQALIDNKGFTRQEELDQLGLVHLNGRVYDPFTGRFMSGDPDVADPYHSQSYNRYTYVWNNPTNLTDPTGFNPNGQNNTTAYTEADWENFTVDQKRMAFNAYEHGTGDGLGNSIGLANNTNTTSSGANGSGVGGIIRRVVDKVLSAVSGAAHAGGVEEEEERDPREEEQKVEAEMESARLTPRVNELIKQIRAFKPNYSYDRFTLPGKGGYTESDVEYLENTLVETEALRAKPIAGGGANLKNLTPLEIVRIQNAANRTGVQITVVGSRAGGTAGPLSDWDYVVPKETASRTIHSLSSSLPEGFRSLGEPRHQDFFRGSVNQNDPFITFNPQPK